MHEDTSRLRSQPRSQLQALPYGVDVLRHLAEQVISDHREQLPDLTDVTILLPSPQSVTRLRRLLLDSAQARDIPALLGPEIDTFSGWTSHQPGSELAVLSEHQRELMLVEALIKHPYLYGEGNPWMLADSLLELFDELNETHIKLPASFEDFLAQLGTDYGLPNLDNESLVGEARLVHTLWQAWHQQMQDTQVTDRHSDHRLKLIGSAQQTPAQHRYYVAGFASFTPAQIQWLSTLMAGGQATLLLQGSAPGERDYHPDSVNARTLSALDQHIAFPPPGDDYGHCLDAVFNSDAVPLQERAQHIAAALPQSPLAPRLRLFEAGSAEQEARAIDLQTRRWWLEGKRRIGIVTENRRLARRVRALLERAGLTLQDAAGWALSTTSAAATLERWLETVEEDFAYQPLLDLLKSPLLLPEQDRDSLLATVYRFEQGIVLKENIARGLARFRQHTRYRQHRLPTELTAEYEDIHSLLDTLELAAAPLLPFVDGRKHAPTAIISALQASLQQLGLDTGFSLDAAGQRILEELEQMQAASRDNSLQMDWQEFRTWLGRTLERFNFQPPAQAGQVRLMGLAQSATMHFDALIIAGAEREHLPGSGGNSPFFNDGVRQALGLSSRTQRLAQKFYQFRALLESAPAILITRRREQDGEDIVATPWLEQLQSFHRLAYGDDLLDQQLMTLVDQSGTQVSVADAPLPGLTPANPSIVVDASLLPGHYSASSYQQLINCPYQFFAARCLKLEPPESIREMLEKSDYGERVHRCLEAFHSDVPDLPGPFTGQLDKQNLSAAEHCLHEITDAVFARDLEDNFLHRGWVKRWRDIIPHYLLWQLDRQTAWTVRETEVQVDTPLAGSNIALRGRLDRLDGSAEGIGVLDYKTGAIAHADDVQSGEAVQLPFYALLAEQGLGLEVGSVEYVALDKGSASSKGQLDGESLHELKQENGTRLAQLSEVMHGGSALPAWGDEITCSHCHMSGICRREAWQEN